MPTYLHPGVYVEEIPSGSKPIEGVATSVAAFVGPVYKGPAGEAELIHSLDKFFEKFGKVVANPDGDKLREQENSMVHAVRAFYLNGGKDAYICRLVNSNPPSQKAHAEVNGQGTGNNINVIKIEATSVGKWGNDTRFRILKPDPDQTPTIGPEGKCHRCGQETRLGVRAWACGSCGRCWRDPRGADE